jgi:hypothetical protein
MAEIVMQVESAVVAAFVELVAKLNDTAFRPLFRKLFDWAFTGTLWHVLHYDAFSESHSSTGVECGEENCVLQCLYRSFGLFQGNAYHLKSHNYTR